MSDFSIFISAAPSVFAAAFVAGLGLSGPAFAGGAAGSPGMHDPQGHALNMILKRNSGSDPAFGANGGRNNSVQVVQTGDGNRAFVRQDGNNNSVNLNQHGGNNAKIIIQLGNGSSANATQMGNEAGWLVQFGPGSGLFR